jgi:hypothetical protein
VQLLRLGLDLKISDVPAVGINPVEPGVGRVFGRLEELDLVEVFLDGFRSSDDDDRGVRVENLVLLAEDLGDGRSVDAAKEKRKRPTKSVVELD